MYFFFHFYNGGMLSDLIKAKGKLEEKLAARIIEQLLRGLIELCCSIIIPHTHVQKINKIIFKFI